MDISKILCGKWVKVDEKIYNNSSCLIFNYNLSIMAFNIMGTKVTKGYYVDEQSILIFLNGDLVHYTIAVSTSGDVLTLTDSEGMKTEYIKFPGFISYYMNDFFGKSPSPSGANVYLLMILAIICIATLLIARLLLIVL